MMTSWWIDLCLRTMFLQMIEMEMEWVHILMKTCMMLMILDVKCLKYESFP